MNYPIAKRNFPLVLSYLDNATTIVSDATQMNGLLRGIQITAPDLDSTNTYSLTIKDADGYTIFTKASLVENTTTTVYVDTNNQPLQLPLQGAHTVTIVTSGAQTANRAFSVKLLVAGA